MRPPTRYKKWPWCAPPAHGGKGTQPHVEHVSEKLSSKRCGMLARQVESCAHPQRALLLHIL